MKNLRRFALAALTLAGLAGSAAAHTLSNSYVSLVAQGKTVSGQWDIPIRDLEFAIGLDANVDGAVTWQELKDREKDLQSLAASRLAIRWAGQELPLKFEKLLVDRHGDGAYAVLLFTAESPTKVPDDATLDVHYDLMFESDPQHRGFLNVAFKQETEMRPSEGFGAARGLVAAMVSGEQISAVFSPDHRDQTFSKQLPARLSSFRQFFVSGVGHIWGGYDHVAFLMALLLPAVLIFRRGHWEPAVGFRATFLETLKIVTAFSLAHSVTLSLAALDILHLPSRPVECIIAASIVCTALNNMKPVVIERHWLFALGFGLIHGFGFASALGEMGLQRGTLVRTLFAFNLGIETGQLAIVAVFLPIAYRLRKTRFYQRGVLLGGSLLIGIFGLLWLTERLFGVSLIS